MNPQSLKRFAETFLVFVVLLEKYMALISTNSNIVVLTNLLINNRNNLFEVLTRRATNMPEEGIMRLKGWKSFYAWQHGHILGNGAFILSLLESDEAGHEKEFLQPIC